MTWKVLGGRPENFLRTGDDVGRPPTITVVFGLPSDAPADLDGDAEAEGCGPLNAFIADWQGRSAAYAAYRRLQAEQAKVVGRRAELRGEAKRIGAELDDALYNAACPATSERKLEAVARDLRAAEYRAERLDSLVPAAKKAAADELRTELEAERLQIAARLTEEMNAVAGQLAEAAESLAGGWYVKSNALHKVSHSYDKDRFIADALA